MRIWIDFINTPQVTFFVPFIKDFRQNNHEIILTCRDSGNTVALLQQQGIPFEIIGMRAGKQTFQKLFFFPVRLFKLFRFIKSGKPDIAVSQSSFYQPVVAKMLGIPCLYTNDNEHAKGNIFGFLFASRVILPSPLRTEKFSGKWLLNSKLEYYPGVKEAIYLSQTTLPGDSVNTRSKIYFRPEPWSAQYYKGPLNFFDDVLLDLSEDYEVIVLPRDANQIVHYSHEKFKAVKVARKPISLNDIISDCVLFIGAGGSMTREMAVMGTPVISIYQSELLAVDKFLIERGYMIIDKNITYSGIKQFIGSPAFSKPDRAVLREGEESYRIIKNLIYGLRNE